MSRWQGGFVSARPHVRVLLVISMLAVVTVPINEAAAHHSLVITHEPPASAVAGDELVLTAEVVSTCTINCGDIFVKAVYVNAHGGLDEIVEVASGDGVQANATGNSTAWSPSGSTAVAVDVTIPGDAVRFPNLNYRLVAWQEAMNALESDVHLRASLIRQRGFMQ